MTWPSGLKRTTESRYAKNANIRRYYNGKAYQFLSQLVNLVVAEFIALLKGDGFNKSKLDWPIACHGIQDPNEEQENSEVG
jgi:hypothetical protein